MAYNETLANRIREILAAQSIEATEKKMFGGLAFMIDDKMSVGVTHKGDLMVRCLPEKKDWALEQPECRPMDFTGKPMKNFLFVDAEACPSDKELAQWVQLGVDFVQAS